jgi:hypothetical protein
MALPTPEGHVLLESSTILPVNPPSTSVTCRGY